MLPGRLALFIITLYGTQRVFQECVFQDKGLGWLHRNLSHTMPPSTCLLLPHPHAVILDMPTGRTPSGRRRREGRQAARACLAGSCLSYPNLRPLRPKSCCSRTFGGQAPLVSAVSRLKQGVCCLLMQGNAQCPMLTQGCLKEKAHGRSSVGAT